MTSRSRRPATLPARRGMRAPWLRCRIPNELDATVRAVPGAMPAEDSPPPAEDARPPAEDGAGDAALETTAAPGIVRPAFGHPTF